MRKNKIKIGAIAFLLSSASLTVSAQQNQSNKPQKTKPATEVAKPFTVCGKTYANQTDYDKVMALVNKKVKSGQTPPVVTDAELREMNVTPVSTK